jgi:hypothetical protein
MIAGADVRSMCGLKSAFMAISCASNPHAKGVNGESKGCRAIVRHPGNPVP